MLNITYKNGRGHLQIDLSSLLPCSAADFKRLLSFVDLSDDIDGNASVIHGHISDRVRDLQDARAALDPNSGDGKAQIAKINAEIKRYLSHADVLTKKYDLPALSDNSAQISLRPATVYALVSSYGETGIDVYSGWTFCKAGYQFDVYKKICGRSSCYYILLHGTGLQVACSKRKNTVTAEITPDVLATISKFSVKIESAKQTFRQYMIKAGYIEADLDTNNHTENNEEEDIMAAYTTHTATYGGKTYPAEYNIGAYDTVIVYLSIGTFESKRWYIDSNGSQYLDRHQKERLVITPDDFDYQDALTAAKAYLAESGKAYGSDACADTQKPAKAADLVSPVTRSVLPSWITEQAVPVTDVSSEPITEQAAPTLETVSEPTADQVAPASVASADATEEAADPKRTRGPVPEKTFIGECIKGNGWRILFDGDASRTRIMFDGKPTDAARAAIEQAGFYYSPRMESWNKKLTFKAYRAAKAVSTTLSELYAA